MPSQTRENYLKALYHLHQRDASISLTDLGREMSVSKPTANDMVKKLKARGWVDYERYKPLTLTSEGRLEAAAIVRKHRLAEMFLAQRMGFGWEEVHEMAEELEHIQSEKFFNRMDELLGFPTVDPHGSPIPDRFGRVAAAAYVSLAQIPAKASVTVRALRDSSEELLVFLNKKNIGLGTELQVLEIEPFDRSYTISYDGRTDILSVGVCGHLLVEEMGRFAGP